jgi:hypothetical protein
LAATPCRDAAVPTFPYINLYHHIDKGIAAFEAAPASRERLKVTVASFHAAGAD